MTYQWILFDLDNTLMDFDQSEKKALQLAIEELDVPYLERYLHIYHKINKKTWRAYEDGDITKAELRSARFIHFFKAINLKEDPLAFGNRYLYYLSQTPFMMEGAMELLDAIQARYKMAIITNGFKEVQRPRLKKMALEDYFETIVVSDEIGVSKPDAAFFEYTFEQIEHPPKKEVLVVGDNINSDIKGGHRFGLDTCWMNPARNRNNAGIKPTYTIQHLEELKKMLL